MYDDSLIICSHNYNAVSFEDADGVIYDYAVTKIEILSTGDIGDMTACNPGLTLFTCTRVTDGCERV